MFEILALKNHKILTVETDHFIFKCSYLLANRSLEAWANAHKTKYIKAVGEIDYNTIRYQDEELTASDWFYQFSDVACQSSAWEVERGAFDVQTIPLTSTGFVRYDGRQLFRKDSYNRDAFLQTQLTAEQYEFCRLEFAGGYTHGNRFVAGKIIKNDGTFFIKHRDYRSFYPSTTRVDYFPIGQFVLTFEKKAPEDKFPESLLQTRCCLCKVLIENPEIKRV